MILLSVAGSLPELAITIPPRSRETWAWQPGT